MYTYMNNSSVCLFASNKPHKAYSYVLRFSEWGEYWVERQIFYVTRLQIDMFYCTEVNITFNRWASFVNRCRKLYLSVQKDSKKIKQ
jgi:hypothetical protein